MFQSKLQSTYYKVLLQWGSLKIYIFNISCHYTHSLKGCSHDFNPYSITWDTPIVTWSFRICSAVAILDPSCLPHEVHIHIKYNMRSWLCTSWWWILSILQDLEICQNLVHIFRNGILPYCISVLGTQLFIISNRKTCEFYWLLLSLRQQWLSLSYWEWMEPTMKMQVHMKCLMQLKKTNSSGLESFRILRGIQVVLP